jgi:hypothetical protein
VRAHVRYQLVEWGWRRPQLGNDKTAYIVGLLGSGRWYINELILKNFGERARYFRDELHFQFHSEPTSLIYSGHATMKHASSGLQTPEVTSHILEAVRSGTANLIFVYRHPLDSLLTNWVWWRKLFEEKTCYSGISQIYRNSDELCTDLDQNFAEFEIFSQGGPLYFWANSGPPFLSFSTFVEETELYLKTATLALRLENFAVDPRGGFLKLADFMSVAVDERHLRVPPPKSKPYGHLVVQENVPRFRRFVDVLDSDTKRRIEAIGYSLTG